jgi:hypothetical protein
MLLNFILVGVKEGEGPIQWAPGALPPGVKRPGRQADHSLSPTAEMDGLSYNIKVKVKLSLCFN